MSVYGRDAGQTLIGEGLAHTYVCSCTRCSPRRRCADSNFPSDLDLAEGDRARYCSSF